MNVSFISLGCDKNRVNTEQMMALCLQAGHTVQEDCSGSDVVVINTCGFIDSAKSEAIERFIRSKCKGKPLDRETQRKLAAALQRRGFSWQEIRPVLNRLGEEMAEE